MRSARRWLSLAVSCAASTSATGGISTKASHGRPSMKTSAVTPRQVFVVVATTWKRYARITSRSRSSPCNRKMPRLSAIGPTTQPATAIAATSATMLCAASGPDAEGPMAVKTSTVTAMYIASSIRLP